MSRELDLVHGLGTEQWVSASTMLRAAADQLAGGGPKKWVKGDFHDRDGGSCALGAIEDAMNGKRIWYDDFEAAQTALLHTLKDMHPELTANTIPDLNDDPAVTFEDVVAAFEKTAMAFEEKGE